MKWWPLLPSVTNWDVGLLTAEQGREGQAALRPPSAHSLWTRPGGRGTGQRQRGEMPPREERAERGEGGACWGPLGGPIGTEF